MDVNGGCIKVGTTPSTTKALFPANEFAESSVGSVKIDAFPVASFIVPPFKASAEVL